MEYPSDRPRMPAGKPNVHSPMSLKPEVIAMSLMNIAEVRTTSSPRTGRDGCALSSKPSHDINMIHDGNHVMISQMAATVRSGVRLVGTDRPGSQGEYLEVCAEQTRQSSGSKQSEVAPHSSECLGVAPECSFTTAGIPKGGSMSADTESLLGPHGRVTSIAKVRASSKHDIPKGPSCRALTHVGMVREIDTGRHTRRPCLPKHPRLSLPSKGEGEAQDLQRKGISNPRTAVGPPASRAHHPELLWAWISLAKRSPTT